MYDILVYLFENYYTPEACPRAEILASKLAAAGFEHEDIDDALSWLRELANTTEQCLVLAPLDRHTEWRAPRIYTEREYRALGTEAIGFIVFLENSGVLPPALREILIGCAQAAHQAPLSLTEAGTALLGDLSVEMRGYMEEVASRLGDNIDAVTQALEILVEAVSIEREEEEIREAVRAS